MGSIETELQPSTHEAARHDEITVVVTGFGVSLCSIPSTLGDVPQFRG